MSDVFYIGEFDTSPDISRQLLDGASQPIDLTGASVEFRLATLENVAVASGACTITDAAGGWVSYAWAAGDTDLAGSFRAKFTITFASAQVGTVPNNGALSVIIDPAIPAV